MGVTVDFIDCIDVNGKRSQLMLSWVMRETQAVWVELALPGAIIFHVMRRAFG